MLKLSDNTQLLSSNDFEKLIIIDSPLNKPAGVLVELTKQLSKTMAEPLRQFTFEMEKISPIIKLNEVFREAFKPVFDDQKTIMAGLIKSLVSSIEFPKLDIFPSHITDDEVEEKEDYDFYLTDLENAIISQPAFTPAQTTRASTYIRGKMGLKQIPGGNFTYKRRVLEGLSLGNREGKLLELFLLDDYLFISDKTVDDKLGIKDLMDFSQIIKLLRNKFKINGLKANIKRQGLPAGYIIVNIAYLH